jgi:hypothetical protein
MAMANVGWGAPKIHGELLKLGIVISESSGAACADIPEIPVRNSGIPEIIRDFLLAGLSVPSIGINLLTIVSRIRWMNEIRGAGIPGGDRSPWRPAKS